MCHIVHGLYTAIGFLVTLLFGDTCCVQHTSLVLFFNFQVKWRPFPSGTFPEPDPFSKPLLPDSIEQPKPQGLFKQCNIHIKDWKFCI